MHISRTLLLCAFGVAILLVLCAVSVAWYYYMKNPATSSFLPENALYRDETQSNEVRVADLLLYMTLEEKIGQMALIEKNSLEDNGHIVDYHLGALLSGSGSKPPQNTSMGWRVMVDNYQAEAARSRLGIPLLYGVDAIHGHAHVPTATVFPHAIGLGATKNSELVERIGNATAEQLLATGINWNFAPTLDQPKDIRWGRVYEAFSDHPDVVSELGAAYVRGLQGSRGNDTTKIRMLATAKHYVGLGSMQWGTSQNKDYSIDQGVTPPDETRLRSEHLPAFREVLEAGALSVMVGLNSWGDTRLVSSRYLLTDVLKEELGFKGFIVSDWYGAHEGRRNTFFGTVSAVNAGVDMLMLPFDYQTFIRHMKWAYWFGLVSEERIDEAVSRILHAKFALGLFDINHTMIDVAHVTNNVHRSLAREAVAESLVLLKNDSAVLPVTALVKHIKVVGSAADNVGRQAGAWTIEWQGIDGNQLPGATSILAGLRARAGADVLIEYSEIGDFPETSRMADLGIAIVGEKPYAEGWGDSAHPELTSTDREAITQLQKGSRNVIVVLVSGRPLFITNEFESWDALVAAWLPGSEGGVVADVLFGDRPFTGTLPLPWPRHSEQLPITQDEITADGTPLLFLRGFGLR